MKLTEPEVTPEFTNWKGEMGCSVISNRSSREALVRADSSGAPCMTPANRIRQKIGFRRIFMDWENLDSFLLHALRIISLRQVSASYVNFLK